MNLIHKTNFAYIVILVLFYLVSTEKDTYVMCVELPTLPRDDYSFA